MANIIKELNQINSAIYGKDVRSSIYNGLTAINNEVEGLASNQQTFESDINKQIETFSVEQQAFTQNMMTEQNTFTEKIDGKIDDVNKLMQNTKTLVDNSQSTIQNATQISEKVSTLEDHFTNLVAENNTKLNNFNSEILRTNLLLASNFTGNSGNDGCASTAYGFAATATGVKVIEGKEYTFTVCGYIQDIAKSEGGALKVCLYDSAWSYNGATIIINSTKPSIQAVTFTATKTEYLYVTSYLNPYKSNYSGCAIINWYSLTEGNVAAEKWTPCSYDLNGGVNLFGDSNFGINGVTTNANGGYWNTSEVELKQGVPYTFTASATTEVNSDNSGALCLIYTSDWSESYNLFFESNAPYNKSLIFIPEKTQKYNFGFYSREIKGTGHNIDCTLNWYSVVQGSRPQAWIPSMGDIRGKSSLQLSAIGKETTELFLTTNKLDTQNKVLGESTSQLILENSKLKDQVKLLGQVIIKMQLNK